MSATGQLAPTARRAAILAATLGIALATLFPGDAARAPGFDVCLLCGELGTLDFLFNILLFFPLGAAVAWGSAPRSSIARAAALALLVSLIVEGSQFIVVPGRDPSLSDLLANTTGGALGAAVGALIVRLRRASRGTWYRVTWLWTLGCAALLAFGAWAVRMDVPNETYYVQWLPRRAAYSTFLGRLSHLALEGRPLNPGEVLPREEIPEHFFTGEVSLSADIFPGQRPEHLALIARLALASGEFFMIGRQHSDLVLRYRTNASRVGLRSPIYSLEGVFARPLDAVRVRVHTWRDVAEMSVITAARRRGRRYRVTAARLWATLLPVDHGFGSLGLLGDTLWLTILFAPAAYGGAKASRGIGGLTFALALAGVVALLAVTYQRTLSWWPLWLTIAAAIAIAYWLGIRSRPRGAPA